MLSSSTEPGGPEVLTRRRRFADRSRRRARCSSTSPPPQSTGPICCSGRATTRRRPAPPRTRAWSAPARSRRSATTSPAGRSATRCARCCRRRLRRAGGGAGRRSCCPCPAGVSSSTPPRSPRRPAPCGRTSSGSVPAGCSRGETAARARRHAAASARMAIQLAKARGARVFATAGTPRKLRRCRELGADVAINYRDEDFVERFANATGGAGRRRDPRQHGRALPRAQRRRRSPLGGRLVVLGLQGGVKGELDLGRCSPSAAPCTPPPCAPAARREGAHRRRGARARLAADRRRRGAPGDRPGTPPRRRGRGAPRRRGG